jgi:hypothetical protein
MRILLKHYSVDIRDQQIEKIVQNTNNELEFQAVSKNKNTEDIISIWNNVSLLSNQEEANNIQHNKEQFDITDLTNPQLAVLLNFYDNLENFYGVEINQNEYYLGDLVQAYARNPDLTLKKENFTKILEFNKKALNCEKQDVDAIVRKMQEAFNQQQQSQQKQQSIINQNIQSQPQEIQEDEEIDYKQYYDALSENKELKKKNQDLIDLNDEIIKKNTTLCKTIEKLTKENKNLEQQIKEFQNSSQLNIKKISGPLSSNSSNS